MALQIIQFSNHTKEDKRWLKKFIDFHWQHYAADPAYVPLLDYEYTGFSLLGIVGFFKGKICFSSMAKCAFFSPWRGTPWSADATPLSIIIITSIGMIKWASSASLNPSMIKRLQML
ncbi:MAG: hypothetical protein BWY83_03127 [bacterium ADurb.Bin478]|nr:MAG: hypothetical protein BWY83_03127 [bacterium ADurb.Bin478]